MYQVIQMYLLAGFLIIGIILLFSVIILVIYYLCKYSTYDSEGYCSKYFQDL